MSRTASTSVPLHPLLAERWSPRSFDPTRPVEPTQLAAVLEAARWAPSSSNSQPWRFVVGLRGDETFKTVFDTLMPGNQVWAANAGVLLVAVTQTLTEAGKQRRHGAYDTGQAVALMTVQAQAEGLGVHQMGGFSAPALTDALGLPEGYEPTTVIAIGHVGDPDSLPEALATRERAPRERRPLAETAYRTWGEPLDGLPD